MLRRSALKYHNDSADYLITVIAASDEKSLTVPSVEAVKNSAPDLALTQIVLYTGSTCDWSNPMVASGWPPLRTSHQQT